MGKFILHYLLHFVLCMYINRAESSLNIFTEHNSAVARKIKKESGGLCVNKRKGDEQGKEEMSRGKEEGGAVPCYPTCYREYR